MALAQPHTAETEGPGDSEHTITVRSGEFDPPTTDALRGNKIIFAGANEQIYVDDAQLFEDAPPYYADNSTKHKIKDSASVKTYLISLIPFPQSARYGRGHDGSGSGSGGSDDGEIIVGSAPTPPTRPPRR